MIKLDELEFKVKAKYPIIHVQSHEEERFLQFAKAHFKDRKFWEWSATTGLFRDEPKDGGSVERRVEADTEDFVAALGRIKKLSGESEERNVVVLKDIHPYLEYPIVRRHLRDLAIQLPHTSTTLFLLGPELRIGGDLEKTISLYEFPLPDEDEMFRFCIAVQQQNRHRIKKPLKDDDLRRVARACLGLTRDESENVLSKSAAKHGALDLSEISTEKREILKKAGIEVREPKKSLSDVGGLDLLKDYIQRVNKARTSPKAKEYGVPAPKGIALLGPPGTGKSMVVDAIAALFEVPLIIFEMGQFMGSLVGESQAKLRNAFQRINAIGPSVVRFDEMEKMFAGSTGPSTDSGVSQEMAGMTLTWLQERPEGSYAVGTMNRVINPDGTLKVLPELLRKGRWDELWIIPLPNEKQREEIVRIHLERRGRDPKKFNLAKVAVEAKGFSGAEIETLITDTLFHVFAEDRDIGTADLIEAVKRTSPLSTTMKEEIDRLQEWAKTRNIRSASTEEAYVLKARGGVRSLA